VAIPALARVDSGVRECTAPSACGPVGRGGHPIPCARPRREPLGAVRIRGERRKVEGGGEWLIDGWAHAVGEWWLAGEEGAVWWAGIGASWAARSEQENESGPS
jgi:hypothetical protein